MKNLYLTTTLFFRVFHCYSNYNGTILPDVLGNIPPVTHMERWDQQKVANKTFTREAGYYAARTPDNCIFPLQILIVQDLTDSFSDNIEEMKNKQLQKMIDGLKSSHPNSEFAMMSFQDKPIFPLGNRDDSCLNFDSSFSSDLKPIYDAYTKALSYGGGDAPENQLGAIVAAIQSRKVNWKTPQTPYTKLIVLITDAGPHFSSDNSNPGWLEPFPGKWEDDKADDLCLKKYYPSPEKVRDIVKESETYVASFVFDGDWAEGWAAKSWRIFNRFIGQRDEFCEESAEDSSDFFDDLSSVIKQIENIECFEKSTTTTTTSTYTTPKVHTSGITSNATECNCPPSVNNCDCPELVLQLFKIQGNLQFNVSKY